MSYPSNWWYDPLDYHELCPCEDCHELCGHTSGIEEWIKQGCILCEELFEKDLKALKEG